MSANDIRAELLDHHARLRVKLEHARGLALAGGTRDLHDALVDLSNLLRLHHMREEEMLRDVLPGLDDWGMMRAASMVEEHAEEHRQLYETLITVSTTHDPKRAASSALDLFDRILAHMAEERLFLGPEE